MPGKAIEWTHFNYPPLLKIFHFSRDDFEAEGKRYIK